MEGRLLEAAWSGNLDVVYASFGEDPAIFQKLQCYRASPDTPLHLASMFGHAEFVREYVKLGSITVQQLSELNGDGYSPFHLASVNGHVEIVEHMLEIGERCFAVQELCLKKDKGGRTALHCAAAAGKIGVIGLLLAGCSGAAMEVTVREESVLHMAVKDHQYEALVWLIQTLDSSARDLLINLQDREGNTGLHLAAAQRQLQMVEYLVKLQPGLDVNAKNACGLTALDVISAGSCFNSNNNVYVQEAIRKAGGCQSESAVAMETDPTTTTTPVSGNEEDPNVRYYYSEQLRSGINSHNSDSARRIVARFGYKYEHK